MDSGTWRRVLRGRARRARGDGWLGHTIGRLAVAVEAEAPGRLVGVAEVDRTAGDGGGGADRAAGDGGTLEREVGGGRQHAGAGGGLWLYCARRGGTRLRRQRQRRRRQSMMSASCSSTSPSPSSRHHRPAPETGLGDSGGRGRKVAARLGGRRQRAGKGGGRGQAEGEDGRGRGWRLAWAADGGVRGRGRPL